MKLGAGDSVRSMAKGAFFFEDLEAGWTAGAAILCVGWR